MPYVERVVPKRFRKDRAVRNLITRWRNLHARHRVCERRVNWKHTKAREIEKKRRREKWEIVSNILMIERQIIRWLAQETHHPEIWSSKVQGTLSELRTLHREYLLACNATHNETGSRYKKAMERRGRLVFKIRDIERAWMVAVFRECFPNDHIPNPIKLHPRELRPRKVRLASRRLEEQVA